jgi:hypothetical protein
MARKPILAATGVLVALAALSANPPQPALPPLPANPLGPLVQPPPLAPSAPPLARIPVEPPLLPPAPLIPPIPTAPAVPPGHLLFPNGSLKPPNVGAQPVAPASPPPSQILEPVSAVHRFAGTYLGGTASRAVVYAEADGKAEVLVYALDNTKEPLARCAVPADKPVIRVGVIHFEGEFSVARAVKQTFHDGRAFVLAARELAVVGIEGRAEWSFALPGRADNGERFVALAGFDRGTVLIASSELLKDGKSTGRVYALDSATGKQVAFWKFEGGFDAHALFAVDAQSRVLFANSGSAVRLLQLDRAEPPAQAEHGSAVAHLSAANKMAFFGAPSGALVSDGRENWHLTREAAGTAPAGFAVAPNGARAFVPLRDLQSGQHRLAAYKVGAFVAPEWALNVPKALTAPPVARGGSVYFAAGNVLYRASATTGEVHWKHTLALEPRDALTGMAFDGDALVAWGGGVVARVADPPAVPVAPAPRERPRQVFNFSQGVFGSQ